MLTDGWLRSSRCLAEAVKEVGFQQTRDHIQNSLAPPFLEPSLISSRSATIDMSSVDLLQLFKYSVLALSAVLVLSLARCVYNVTLHPLRKFPGPKLWAASRLVYVSNALRGDLVLLLKGLHEQYGPVVRIAPDELSFIDSDAWKTIYGLHGEGQLPRDPYVFPPELPELRGGIIYADAHNHPRMRRQLAHAFSQRALEEQTPLIQSYIDTLIAQLGKLANTDKQINIADWFNFASFDIIGHLAYGESFGCLDMGQYHEYAAFVLEAFKGGLFASQLNRYGLLPFAKLLMPKEMAKKRDDFIAMSKALTEKRIAEKDMTEAQKHDFFSYMLSKDNLEKSMTYGEMVTNATVFIIAGSESTATLLTGTLLFLLKDPERLTKVIKEVRDAFETEEQINVSASSKLPYMLACLEEGLRMCTPAPFGVARRTTKPTMIAGVEVPKGTSVAVGQFAAWHSTHNFSHPDEYLPERWLARNDGRGEFANDNKAGFFPFSVGPRNCLGKNLAYLEMRLIFARLLWNFDFELVEKDFEWTTQKAFIVWQKEPLMVKVKQRS